MMRALGLYGEALGALRGLEHLLGSLAVLPRSPVDNASGSFRVLDRVPVLPAGTATSFRTSGQERKE